MIFSSVFFIRLKASPTDYYFQIMENAEINALIKIIGLQYRLKYDKDEDMKTLRYGKIMVMADQVANFVVLIFIIFFVVLCLQL